MTVPSSGQSQASGYAYRGAGRSLHRAHMRRRGSTIRVESYGGGRGSCDVPPSRRPVVSLRDHFGEIPSTFQLFVHLGFWIGLRIVSAKLIVEVADRLFRQIGFQETTVADIAR